MFASALPARDTLRMRALLADARRLIWVVDEAGRMQEPSPSWESFTGQSSEQMLGRRWLEALHPEDRGTLAPDGAFLSPTRSTSEELACRVRRADGAWRDVLARALPVKDEAGRLVEWLLLAEDITGRTGGRERAGEEHGRTLAELEARVRLLSAILEQMPVGFLLAGPQGELTYANPQAEVLWGHPLIRSPDVKSYAAYRHYRPDGREYPPEDLPLSRSVLHGEVVRGEVVWLRRPEKDNRFIKANCAPIRDERGQTIAAVAVFDNITEARQAEEHAARLQIITSALSQALTPGDVARAVLSVTLGGMGAEAGAVYRQRADGSLECLHDVGYPESYARHLRSLPPSANNPAHDAVRTGRELWFRSTADLAAKYPEIVALRPLENDHAIAVLPMWVHGQAVGALVLSYPDPRVCGPEELQFLQMLAQQCGQALERARLYEVAEAERQRAEQASRLKDEFLGVLSHELRTPLTAILGWVQLLRTQKLPPEKRERALEVIERNARAQTQLVEDLLDVNRIVSGKLRLEVRPTHLEKVIENAVDVVRPAAEARGIHLQVTLEPQAPPLQGDPDRLQQVVWNLLSNAVKFTPRGGSVTVSLTRGPSHVEIQVRDTGDGIAAGFLPHLFERFSQADASSTRRHGGLGLGLAIVRHLVELHGGTVDAHSAGKGQGATFAVRLPLVAPRTGTAEPVRASPPPTVRRPIDYPKEIQGRHILVVDDEKDSRELVATMLQEGKARVSTAASAAQALELLNREPPELLISDIGMPEMDGYALIREVRNRTPEQGGRVPSVALTAYARQEDRAAALQAGFDSHVTKPLEAAELLWVAASLLRRSA
ncbi:ATP-binding protein [Archangium sp.]|uniref:ATP-binding protein n=1 Tax=Archangium sp. TaxID=1872627 RepID=UPI002D28C542|nr:ATP-binding protein [Archangium sp.]HYO58570.1 ATP-binding protein [Archangium sp.]